MPRTHVRGLGEVVHRQVLVQVVLRVGQRRLDAIRLRVEFGQHRELRLPSRAAMVDHELLRHGTGHLDPEVVLDERQREVDAGRHAGGGPHRAVANEDAVFLDADRRKTALQFARPQPVGRRPPAVQDSRVGQHERAGADAGQAPRGLERVPDQAHQLRGGGLRKGLSRDEQGVVGVRIELGGLDGRPQRALHAPAAFRDDVDLVRRDRHLAVGHLEDRGGRHVDHLEARKDHEADAFHVVPKRGKFVIQDRS